MTDNFYMQLALNKAWQYQGLTYPNPAVGAVVIMDGKILSIEAHQKAGISHVEVLALCSAYEKLSGKLLDFDPTDAQKAHAFLLSLPQNFFEKCSIYVTLKPCSHVGQTPFCASLLQQLNLTYAIIGIKDHYQSIGNLDFSHVSVYNAHNILPPPLNNVPTKECF